MTFAEKKWGDCSKAVAYNLNFVQMCYLSGSKGHSDFFTSSCKKCEEYDIQIKDLEYPKSSFSKKDYFELQIGGYGVSQKLRDDMIAFGVSEDNFRPIYTAKHKDVLGYQICPVNKLPPIYHYNCQQAVPVCDECGFEIYEYTDDSYSNEVYKHLGYPKYLTKDELKSVGHLSGTYEWNDPIISLELYNYLLKKYPRIECRPVFLGTVYEDKEYIRTHSPGFVSDRDSYLDEVNI